MPLPSRPIHVPAGLPINEATRPEILEPGQANLANVNCRSVEKGTLCRRLGFAALSASRFDATTRTAGRRLFSHGTQPATVDGTYADVYDATKSVSVTAKRVPEASVSTRSLALIVTSRVFDVALCNGYLVTIGSQPGGAYASVETTDGSVVLSSRLIFAVGVGNPTMVAALGTYGNYVLAFCTDSGSTAISLSYLDCSSAASVTAGWVLVGSTTVATNKIAAGAGSSTTLATHSLSDRVAVAYVNNTGGVSQVSVKTVTIAGVVDSATINTASVTPTVVGVEGNSSDRLWVCWNQTTTIRVCGFAPTNLASVTATTATLTTVSTAPTYRSPGIVSSTTAGTARVLIETPDGVTHVPWTTAGTVITAGAATNLYGSSFHGRPALLGGRYYAPFHVGTTNEQQLHIVCDFTDVGTTGEVLRPVSSVYPGLVLMDSAGFSQRHFVQLSATSLGWVLGANDSLAITSPTILVTHDFADINRWRTEPFGEATYLTGGVLSYLSGLDVAEAGFLHKPAKPTTSLGGTGITGTNYRYVCVYSTTDRTGNWIVSGVSTPSVAVSPANQTVTVTTTPLTISNRHLAGTASVKVEFFRTLSGGEPPYYYVGYAFSQANGTVSFADAIADAAAATSILLYGNGSLPGTNNAPQERRSPPYANAVAAYGDMLVIASGSDLWYSGQLIQGEAPWFSPAFSLPVPGAGAITALAVQDGTLYVFKESAIYAVAGEAPADNGSSGGLGAPRRLATDVGSIGPVACVTGMGIWFVSKRGVELLNRSGAVQWIGEAVETTLASYPVVTAIVLDTRQNLVRVTCAATEASGVVNGEGRTLVFDLSMNGWVSTDDVRGASAHQPAQDAAMVTVAGEERFAWLSSSGVVYYEKLDSDGTAHLDGSNWIDVSYEMPPIKFGLSQEQRVYEVVPLFERHSACGLNVEVGIDLAAYGTDTKVWTEAQTVGKRRLPFRPKPLHSTLSLRVKDTAPAVLGTGRGMTFVGISADIAPKQGATKGTPRLATGDRR